MNHFKLLSLIAFVLFLVGCASTPDHRAKVAHTQDYLADLQFDGPELQPMETRWWETLNDGQLNHLMAIAHSVNLDLQATDQRLKEALAQLGASQADRFPQGGVAAEYETSTRDGNRTESSSIGGQITWELDLFGRIRSVIDARAAGLAGAHAQSRAALKEVTVGLVEGYLRWEFSRQQVELIESDIKALQSSLTVIQNRVDAGLSPQLDTARAEALLHEQRAQLPVAQTNQFRTHASVAVLLGEDPDNLRLYPAPDTFRKARELPIGEHLGESLQARADIGGALANLAQQTALSAAAVANLYPQVTVEGFTGVSNIASVGDGFESAWSAVPAISWNLLSYPALLKQVDVQTARAEGQYVAYRATVVGAVGQARVVAHRFSQTERSESASAQALEASRTAFETARALYQEGAIGYLELLDANREWIASQRTHLDSQFALADSRLGVLREFSGLWSQQLYQQLQTRKRGQGGSGA
ncbi:TolC family protein [Marinobacter sp.]|uniref:TolC family protein n=1 Tax=Marinobacter sp. TaxID=50741 RepID=UPI003B5277CB